MMFRSGIASNNLRARLKSRHLQYMERRLLSKNRQGLKEDLIMWVCASFPRRGEPELADF